MIKLQTFIPIFLPDSGNLAPMTDGDLKILLSIFIVWNIFNIIALIVEKLLGVDFLDSIITQFFTVVTVVVWFGIILCYFGILISKLF